MDVIKRNTDYAIRAAVSLASRQGKGAVCAAEIAKKEDIPYQLASKILQQLARKKIVESVMGAKGGFILRRKVSKISVLEVIEAIQGPVSLNRCLSDVKFCSRKRSCPVSKNLAKLQKNINKYLEEIRLTNLVTNKVSFKKQKL